VWIDVIMEENIDHVMHVVNVNHIATMIHVTIIAKGIDAQMSDVKITDSMICQSTKIFDAMTTYGDLMTNGTIDD